MKSILLVYLALCCFGCETGSQSVPIESKRDQRHVNSATAGSVHVFTSKFFVSFESKNSEPHEVSATVGSRHVFNENIVKQQAITYGPISIGNSDKVEISWKDSDSREKTIEFGFSSKVPAEFKKGDELKIIVNEKGDVEVYFSCSVKGEYRLIDIPLNESKEEARLRALNEGLLEAAGLGNLYMVKQLLTDGANVNYLFGSGCATPVRLAANGSHFSVVDFLLEHAAKIGRRDLDNEYLKKKVNALGIEVH